MTTRNRLLVAWAVLASVAIASQLVGQTPKKTTHRDTTPLKMDTMPLTGGTFTLHNDDSLVTWKTWGAWSPGPQSITFTAGWKTVLTISPAGKFELGPGATVDDAAREIVRLAEQYMAKDRRLVCRDTL